MTGRVLFVVDAFADSPFTGNPAAVCVVDADVWPDEAWMQALASEVNLSETAFVLCGETGKNDGAEGGAFGLRWFTPAAEVELCGHATLASAHALREAGVVADGETVRFATRFSGELVCTPTNGSEWVMDFPRLETQPKALPAGLLDTLGIDAGSVVDGCFGPHDWVVVVDAPAVVEGLSPDFAALAAFECRGVAVTAAGAVARCEGADFVSRFFAPRLRIAEDPVTGSLHCVLGPYWGKRLGKEPLVGYQCSARGGWVGVRLRGDRVELRGGAVTVVRGRLAASG